MIGVAHAKAILVGEHYVLDGVGAVALSLPGMRTEVRWAEDTGALRLAPNVRTTLGEDASQQTLSMLERVCAATETAPTGEVDVRSSVPIGRGFGSSGALAVAALRARAGDRMGAQALLDAARAVEAVVHGASSGLDPAAAMADGAAIRFADGRLLETIVPPATDPMQRARWVLCDVGPAPSTGVAIAAARAARERLGSERCAALRTQVQAAADAAADGLRRGEPGAIAVAMRQNDAALRPLDVVDDRMAVIIERLLAGGALAAKQSGAGLGGLVLALAPDPRVAATLRAQLDAGGLPSWTVETCR